MVNVIDTQNFDRNRCRTKWIPILERTNISEELFTPISLYCESHSILDSLAYDSGRVFIANQINMNDTLLPESINLISKLNLLGKNIQIASSTTFNYLTDDDITESAQIGVMEVSEPFNREDCNNQELVREITGILIDEMVGLINAGLVEYKTIVLYLMITQISLIQEPIKMGDTRIYLRSRFALMDKIQ